MKPTRIVGGQRSFLDSVHNVLINKNRNHVCGFARRSAAAAAAATDATTRSPARPSLVDALANKRDAAARRGRPKGSRTDRLDHCPRTNEEATPTNPRPPTLQPTVVPATHPASCSTSQPACASTNSSTFDGSYERTPHRLTTSSVRTESSGSATSSRRPPRLSAAAARAAGSAAS
jgi:hypothetical protein